MAASSAQVRPRTSLPSLLTMLRIDDCFALGGSTTGASRSNSGTTSALAWVVQVISLVNIWALCREVEGMRHEGCCSEHRACAATSAQSRNWRLYLSPHLLLQGLKRGGGAVFSRFFPSPALSTSVCTYILYWSRYTTSPAAFVHFCAQTLGRIGPGPFLSP